MSRKKIVDEAITRAAKTIHEPEVVTEKRAAKTGDVLVIDFDGSVDGKPQPGMKGEGHKLELGSKSFIDTFEDQLVGAKVGDHKTLKVTFPKDYHAENLAGKAAVFEVDVKELRAQETGGDERDALAKELGFPVAREIARTRKDRYRGELQECQPRDHQERFDGQAGQGISFRSAARHAGRRVRLHLAAGGTGEGARRPAGRRQKAKARTR